MKNPINFKTSSYLSSMGKFLCIVTLFAGLMIISLSLTLGILISVLSVTLFFAHYRLEINFDNKEFFDYCWVMGFKFGEREKFEQIEYFFIKKNRVTQKMHSRVSSSLLQKEVYDVFIRFSEDQKVHLFTCDDKQEANQKINKLVEKLDLHVVDYAI